MDIKEIDITPAELKAIEEHKYYMSQRQNREVTIEEAIEDFIRHYKEAWIKEKQKNENLEQIEEIKKYMHMRSEEMGQTIGELTAAEEWRTQYAHIWRAEKESLEKNGFAKINVIVQNEKGLHMRPSSTLAVLTSRYDCDVYVHKDGMEHYNFVLNGQKYMNVKSVLGVLTLAACKGEKLEFIATGREAKEALEAIEEFVNNGCQTCK
ncbi:MAG: HPr family phosphocarrier protein [Spirochaetales bacterium]|nr:HPr family phosphocarrier protein [Spirochaetales bacterium]